jgi:hypothetical protein
MVEWRRAVQSARTAAYPAVLGVVLTIFVWQAVAAWRAGAPAPRVSDEGTNGLTCRTLVHGVLLGMLPEASGLALSGRTPGAMWSMNDSGVPFVFALNQDGQIVGRVRVTGANIYNWEDVSIARCGSSFCLYVSDTGDEGGTQRNDITIYRIPEPNINDKTTAPPEVINAVYPDDEDHESEAVFVVNGQLYLVTKGHPSLVFRFPRETPAGSLVTLERVGQVPTERFLKNTIRRQTRITDAETSPDGKWVAMRTNKALLLYKTEDVIAGRFNTFWHADLAPLDEPQGEGVAISNDGDVYLASEGGGHALPGTFAHLKCDLPR